MVLIGNAPSSGSTLLADLMDAIPDFACGPESKFFCYKELYEDFERFKKNARHIFAFPTPSLQNFRGTISRKKEILAAYGFSGINEVIDLLEASSDNVDFARRLQKHFLQWRNMGPGNVLVEKYPENIFIAPHFLDTFADGYFIHIVRNPLYVYSSLRKKNFSPVLAISTWLISTAIGYDLRNHPRFLTISYRDLVTSPFEKIAELAGKITGNHYSPADIKKRYETNMYREKAEFRDESWNVSEYGVVKDSNSVNISMAIRNEYDHFGHIRINRRYTDLYDIPNYSINELCSYYGYDAPALDNRVPIDLRSKKHLFLKFGLDLVHGTCGLSSLSGYLNPIKPNGNN